MVQSPYETGPILSDKKLKIVIRIEPQPARFIRTKWGIAPTSEHTKHIGNLRYWLENYKDSFPDVTVPLACTIGYFLSHSKETTDFPTSRPDVDNLNKVTLDALKPQRIRRQLASNGVIADDSQITDLYTYKRWAKIKTLPKIIITLWSLTQIEKNSGNTKILPHT
jgi:Holliday junction resolvase RusA-like endonuclease